MILNDTKINVEYDFDRLNHPDTEQIRGINGKMYPLGEFRKLFSDNFSEKKHGMVLFYDDMFQYTSLGLLDMLFELHHINFPLPVKEYLTRGVQAEEFVKTICSLYDIDYKEAQIIERKYYAEVLRRSPFSKNAKAFLKMRKSLNSQRFVFKYPCNGINDILSNYRNYYTSSNGEYASLEADYLNGRSETDYLNYLVKSNLLKYLDIIVIRNAGAYMDFVQKTHIDELVGSNVLTTEYHNGLSPIQLASIYIGKGYGNGDYTISLMKEEGSRS